MDTLLYIFARGFVTVIQWLPLPLVARLGRMCGALVCWLDARHRNVALKNLTMVFGQEKSPAELLAITKENFKRLGENFASAIKTAAMTPDQMKRHFIFLGAERIMPATNAGPQNRVFAIGHFGNFELYARFSQLVPIFKSATTYRALRQPGLNRLMQELRATSGCRFFERRTEAAALKAAMADTGLLLGLSADQHAGMNGLHLQFFGHDCSVSSAPAVFALRYGCPLHTAICYRIRLAYWEIEVGKEIPTLENGQPRTLEAIMRDVNAEFEKAIRRDPANWFWVHNRWKPERLNARKAAVR